LLRKRKKQEAIHFPLLSKQNATVEKNVSCEVGGDPT